MTEPDGPSRPHDPADGPDHSPDHSPDESTGAHLDLGADEEAAVARLLGGLRETRPVPDDVAARLDRALAELDTERIVATERADAAVLADRGDRADRGDEADRTSGSAPGAASGVTSIADRRRRRRTVGSRVTGGVVAAAVVLVVGGGTWALTSRGGGESNASTDSAASSGSAAGGSVGSPEQADAGTGTDQSGESGTVGQPSPLDLPSRDTRSGGGALPVVSSLPGDFRRDASRALARVAVGSAAAAGGRSGCPLPAGLPADADVVRVVLDGRPGLLVGRQVGGGRRLAEAYSCTGGGPVASAVVGRRLLR